MNILFILILFISHFLKIYTLLQLFIICNIYNLYNEAT